MLERAFTSEAFQEALEILRYEFPLALWETVYVTLLSTAFAIVLGLPLGVLLAVGRRDGILPLPGWLRQGLNLLINLLRSVPFLILMVLLIPLTRAIVGTPVGTVASIVPLLIGIILGNLDPRMRQCLSAGGEVTIMVLGFALGANMSLQQVAQGGVPGIVLGLITVVIGGVFNILFDKLTGGSGIAGASISSVGGNAVATPMALAAVDKSLEGVAAIAQPQVAAAVVVTAILCPMLTNWISKRNGGKKKATLNEVEDLVADESNTI